MFVYIIRNSDTGHLKIGKATDVHKRLSGLQTSNASELVLEAFCQEFPPITESALHTYCESARIRGEWFVQTDTTTALIQAMKRGSDFVSALIKGKGSVSLEEYAQMLEAKNKDLERMNGLLGSVLAQADRFRSKLVDDLNALDQQLDSYWRWEANIRRGMNAPPTVLSTSKQGESA